MINPNLITWTGMNVELIERSYNKIMSLIKLKSINKIKQMMINELPEYDIKCDEENNPPEIIDSGHIFVRVSKKINNKYFYVDVIF